MWRSGPTFLDFVQDLTRMPVIDEIIVINNDLEKTPDHAVLMHPKVRIFSFGRNIYVNPAWNFGVHASNSDIVCIMNDDLLFDLRLFFKVADFMGNPEASKNFGSMGLSNGVIEYGQTPLTNGDIKFEPFVDQACYGFGNLMFVKKSLWSPIPDGLDITHGDVYIFDHSYFSGRQNYFITNLMHCHEGSMTVKDIQTPDFFVRENALYKEIKQELINQVSSKEN